MSNLSSKSAGPVSKAQLLAGVQAMGVLTFTIIAWVFTAGVLGEPGGIGPVSAPLPGVLVVVAALLLVAAPLVERRLLAAPTGATADEGARDRYLKAKIVSYALREVAGLLGGLLILFGETAFGAGVAAAALVTMAIAWPRASDLAARPGDLNRPPESPVEPR